MFDAERYAYLEAGVDTDIPKLYKHTIPTSRNGLERGVCIAVNLNIDNDVFTEECKDWCSLPQLLFRTAAGWQYAVAA